MTFQRNLSDDFINALNRLYDRPTSWWRELADSKKDDVFLAIRNDALNAYSGGMSIGKIVWDRRSRSIQLSVHEEYLTLKSRELYVDLLPGKTSLSRPLASNEASYLANLPRIKKRASRFGGDERKGTNLLACHIYTVLDMEAAFDDRADQEPDPEDEKKVSADKRGRIDLIVLAPDSRLLIIEAKLYANGELRATETPKVCGQLQEYHDFLAARRRQLETAYRKVVSIFGQLRGSFFEKRACHANLVQAHSDLSAIAIDPVPRLLIFGFDTLQGRGCRENCDRIQTTVTFPGFERRHVIPVGNPRSVKDYHLT